MSYGIPHWNILLALDHPFVWISDAYNSTYSGDKS